MSAISRRDVLKGTGALVVSFELVGNDRVLPQTNFASRKILKNIGLKTQTYNL